MALPPVPGAEKGDRVTILPGFRWHGTCEKPPSKGPRPFTGRMIAKTETPPKSKLGLAQKGGNHQRNLKFFKAGGRTAEPGLAIVVGPAGLDGLWGCFVFCPARGTASSYPTSRWGP